MICFDQNQRIHDDLRPFSGDAPYSWWAFRTDRSLFLVLCSSSDALDWLSDWGNQFNKAASAPSFVEHLQRLQKIEACLQRHLGSFHPSMTSSHAEYEHNFAHSSSQLVQPAIFGLPGGFFVHTTIYPQNDGPWKWCFLLNMAFLVSMLNFCGIHESLTVCLMDPSFCSNLIINLYHFSGSNTPSSDMGIGAFFSVDAS